MSNLIGGDEELRRLKREINPITLLKAMGMERYTLDSRGRLRTRCPIHGGTSDNNFVGNLEKGRFTCYGEGRCVVSGDIFDVAIAKFGDKATGIRFVKDFGRPWSREEREYIEIRLIQSRQNATEKVATEEMVNHYREQDVSCWLYRGISPPVIERFELGYAPASDRAVFPLRDENGSLYGLQGRIVDPIWLECGMERYITYPPGVFKSMHVYGLYQALELKRWEQENLIDAPKRDTFLLFEGNFCTVAAHQCAEQSEGTHLWRPEFEMAGSVMGSAISKTQADLIAKHFTRIIVVPDWNPNTCSYAESLVESARQQFDGICTVYRANLPEYEQFGDSWLKDFGDFLEYKGAVDLLSMAIDRRKFVG